MKNSMEYRGYVGSVEFSEEERLLFGRVQGIRSLISYESGSVESLIADFHGAVDDYLAMCEAEGIVPETAYKGSFNVRIAPDLHRRLALGAADCGASLNNYVAGILSRAVQQGAS